MYGLKFVYTILLTYFSFILEGIEIIIKFIIIVIIIILDSDTVFIWISAQPWISAHLE